MAFSSVITSAPWHPGQWPHPFVPGTGVSIDGFRINSTGGGGGGGGGGTTQSAEGFSITLDSDWVFVDPGGGASARVTGWTDVPDTATFIVVDIQHSIYNTTTSGLDTALGVYTAPFAGEYLIRLMAPNGNPSGAYLAVNAGASDPLEVKFPLVDNITTAGVISLAIGDVVSVYAGANINKETALASGEPSIIWQMTYLSGIPGTPGAAGPQGPPGTATPSPSEGFSITIAADWTNPDGSGTNYNHVTNWTATPVIADYSFDVPSNFYNTISATGTLDLAAGTFTVTRTGLWYIYSRVYDVCIDSPGSVPDISQYSTAYSGRYVCYLTAGQVLTVDAQDTIITKLNGAPPAGPYLIWEMVCLEGAVGPAGPAGAAGTPGGINQVEGFGVILSQNWVHGVGSDFKRVTDWTTTISPVDFPAIDTQLGFNTLSTGSGTLDLAAGTFTAAANGLYQINLNYYSNPVNVLVTRNAAATSATRPPEIFPRSLEANEGTGFNISEQVYLLAGDVVTVMSDTSVPYTNAIGAPLSFDAPALRWSMTNLSGTPVAPLANLPEEFSVTIAADYTPPGLEDWERVPNWTTTLNPAWYPVYRTRKVFSSLNYGTLDLAAGTFTCGKAGIYYYHLDISVDAVEGPQTFCGIAINHVDNDNTGLLQTARKSYSQGSYGGNLLVVDSGMVHLEVGDVVDVRTNFEFLTQVTGPFPTNTNETFPPLWSMKLLS